MEFQLQVFEKKLIYFAFVAFQSFLVLIKNQEIVNVSYVKLHPELVLNEIIQLTQVDIGKELTGQIPKRHSFSRSFRFVVCKN